MKVQSLLLTLSVLAILPGCAPAKKTAAYEFGAVQRGSLEKTVSSAGTLNPVATVKVLPRMNGKVEKIFVDYNSPVKQGEVLAELNTDVLRLQREQQKASVIKARANYELQLLNYQNQQMLAEKNLISSYELKTSKTSLEIQAADLAASELNLQAVETEINQYAYLTSPINGIVLERNVNVGDTVVESSNSTSTSVFTLAENLTEMQIEAGVGELDVASIHQGQEVRFTLESLPGRTFTGTVDSLRLVPKVTNSVVSYTVIISVENKDGSLLPGMTCAVEFIVDRRENILLVPNAALRYQPTGLSAGEISELVFNAGLRGMSEEQREAAVAARAEAQSAQAAAQTARPGAAQGTGSSTGLASLVGGAGGPGMGGMMRGPGGGPGARTGGQGSGGTARRAAAVTRNLWYVNGEGKLDVMRVQTGITNGSLTEVFIRGEGNNGNDMEGMQIILREKL